MLEELWAKRAFEHAEIHFNVIQSLGNFTKLSNFNYSIILVTL